MRYFLDLGVGLVLFKLWVENRGGMFFNRNLGYCEEKKEWILERGLQNYIIFRVELFFSLVYFKKEVLKGIIFQFLEMVIIIREEVIFKSVMLLIY